MIATVDWGQPWLTHLKASGEQVTQALASGLPLHLALGTVHSDGVRFVPQQQLPEGEAYERFIFNTGQCPTRDNLHDFFNGLCWLQFPRTKRALNRLQAEAIARDGIGSVRGAVRDAVTVFDENGAVLLAPRAIWDALLARDWRRLFVELRSDWDHATLLVFGHALLEGLADPRKELTAHIWRPEVAAPSVAVVPDVADMDAWLAAQCSPGFLATKPFTPLPVLGVPGWWPGNTNFSFYDDSHVFRPRRTPEPR